MNKQRRRNVQPNGVGSQIPGCLGRMVNLFDFGTVGTGNNLLTQKPHFDQGVIKRNQIEDKVDVRNGGCTIGVNGTPMKKLLAEEMSKEMEVKLSSTNLVAKLMGLDSFPQTQPNAISQRSKSSKSRLKRSLSHGECNGVEGLSKKEIDIVRENFLEAKRLVTVDKLRQSNEFQEAIQVLSSNKELFLEFLHESNNFFSHHLHSFPSTVPPTTEKSKRIIVLKPSLTIDDDNLGNGAAIESSKDGMKSHLFKWPVEEEYLKKKSTRIVVLKPNSGHIRKAASCPTSPRSLTMDDFGESESKDVAKRVKRLMLKEEALHSSVFSNGYENDYVNKYDSPFSSSPFSRASGSPESSSVCREAKKRLSERWALMAASKENLREAKAIQKKGSNSTLGDMLALSDSRKDISEEEEVSRESASFLAGNFSREEECILKPLKILTRSKSLPGSSTSLGDQDPNTNKSTSKVLRRNKKASKEIPTEESQVVHPKTFDSRCNNEFDASMSTRSMFSQESSLSIAKPTSFRNSNEWRDEPSPVSVLETSFDEDDGIFLNSSALNRLSSSLETETMSMRSNLLGKSPSIGSIGRTFSFEDSTEARCYSSKRSTTSTRDEEEDFHLLINTLLSAADLNEDSSSSSLSILDNLLSKWHSLESPLDPSLRNSYANSTEHQRLGSNVKNLVFDLVNTLLLELTPSYLGPCSPKILFGKTLQIYVINRMQECLTGNRRVEDRWWDEDGDLSSLAVNKVVRVEVAEISSPESWRLEMDSMGEELELKLLEELVEEALMVLSQHPKLFI